MKTTTSKPTRLARAMFETAKDMKDVGILDETGYAKITKRHLGAIDKTTSKQLTGDDIRAMRERAHMSQTVFAHCLNVSAGYVSQLERGTKPPTGAVLTLLNVIYRKGIDTIL
jgi:putative transcriptional regulator